MARRALGLSPFAVALTGAGLSVIVVAAIGSLRRQRAVLAAELETELPESLYAVVCRSAPRTRAQWRALREGGLHAWRRSRLLHQLCTELAFKKMQRRLGPEDPAREAEIRILRRRIEGLLEDG
jgi:hypothetical protein